MRWIHPLVAESVQTPDVIGAKACGLVLLGRLGLPVPPGFVIGTEACRAFLGRGRLPGGLDGEMVAAAAGFDRTVSVRSGASESMPGMMDTLLDVGRSGDELRPAVEAVFSSWHTPRARTYRELHGIDDGSGTAVIVQAMVFGDRDEHSGSGVAFSRDPGTGAPEPFGDVLFGHRGDDVVSGRTATRPLAELAEREPVVWAGLLDALRRVEGHYRDACYLEFTYESGELWLLQARPGRFVGAAAVRLAADLADEGVLTRREARDRVPPGYHRGVRLAPYDPADLLGRGIGAGPGAAIGRVAGTADEAVRMAAAGPVILVRPETSPLDMHGIAAAAGIVTARGGPASHAAIVARALGKPAVVGVAGLSVADGTVIAIDGTSGAVVRGRPGLVAAADDPHLRRLTRRT